MKVKITQLCLTLCDPMDYSPWNFPGQNTGVGSLSLLQGIFPTQGLNLGLQYCRQILYQLSHKGILLEWVLDLSNPGVELGAPALWADSLPTELSGKPMILDSGSLNPLNRNSHFPLPPAHGHHHSSFCFCEFD